MRRRSSQECCRSLIDKYILLRFQQLFPVFNPYQFLNTQLPGSTFDFPACFHSTSLLSWNNMISLVGKAIKAKQERKKTESPSASMELQQTHHDAPQEKQLCQHMDAYETSTVKCASCVSEKKAARVYRWKIILGLVAPFALQALDSTM